jgi:uncharacterized protein YgiM (DUF1202 family)
MKRMISAALALAITVVSVLTVSVSALEDKFSEKYTGGKYYDALLRTSLGTDERDSIMTVALSQKGYHEGNNMGELSGENTTGVNGFTEYNYFYGPADSGGYAYPWSFTFIGWCAAQAGISADIFPRYAVASYTIDWFKAKNEYYTASSGYVPKESDIIFIVTGTGVRGGLVRYTAGGTVYTIEGCVNEEVRLCSYSLDDKSIAGYAAPAYGTAAESQARYTVTTSSLRVRSGPGTGYTQLGSVHEGDMITVTGTSDGWAKMTFDSLSGWVSMDYIEAYSDTHTHSYTVTAVAPSGCLYGGCKLYQCSCGRGYTTDQTAAKGHSYTAATVQPTCTASGSTRYTCTVCGDSYTSNVTSATGHKYTDYVTDSGCAVGGSTLHVCTVCGERYTDSYTEPKGHSWGDWYAADGGMRRDCAVCSVYETKQDEPNTMTLSAESAVGYVGDSMTVAVSVSDNPGFWGAAFTVEYDTAVLRLDSVSAGDVLEGAGFDYVASEGRCAVLTENGSFTDSSANGAIALLQFTVISVGESELSVTFSEDNIIDCSGDTVKTVGGKATVTAKALLLGDINLDGKVNGVDVMLLKRFVVGIYTPHNTYAADMDRSGRINAKDSLRLKRVVAHIEGEEYLTSVD